MNERGGGPPSYGALVGRLIKDGEQFAKAKIEVYRQLAFWRARQLRAAVALGMGALMLFGVGVIVLSVGALIVLGQCIGFIWATLILTAIALAGSVALLALARRALPDFGLDEIDEPMGPER